MSTYFIIPTKFTAVDKFTGVMGRMGNAVQSFAAKAEIGLARADRLFRKLTPSISDAAKQLIAFSAASAIALTAGFGVKSIMDYETAIASLQAVTGSTNVQMVGFKREIEDLAKKSKQSAIDVAASFETIGSNMSQYLSDPRGLRLIAEAGITLAKAGRTELQPTLQSLTSIMNQFQLKAESANDVINRLTAGEIVGSVRTAQISEHLQEFGASAFNANVTLSESVALVEALGKQLKSDKIGVGARNIISILDAAKGLDKKAVKDLKSAGVNTTLLMDRTQSLGARLKELSKIKGDAVKMVSVFGRENLTAGQIILNNLDTYDKWHQQILVTNKAQEQAEINSRTLATKIQELKNSFVNTLVATDKLNPTMEHLKSILGFVARNMDTIVSWGAKILLFFAAWKAALIVGSVVMGAYNIALGVTGALTGVASIAIGKSAIALGAYKTVLAIVTAAQWLWNAAMIANPIGLIILGIAALIGYIALVINKWNEWGAALALFSGPLGLIISLIQSFRRNWDGIISSFKSGDILGGIIKIGAAIIDAILMPLQQVFQLISKFTGFDWASSAAAGIGQLRNNLGVNTTTDESGNPIKNNKPVVNPKVTQNEGLSSVFKEMSMQNATLNIKGAPPGSTVDPGKGSLKIQMSSTMGGF